MAYAVEFTRAAEDDLDAAAAYIRRDDPVAAEQMILRIFKRTRMLTEYPRLGRVFSESKNENVREISEKPYRIIYRIIDQESKVQVLRIWHSARSTLELD